MSVEINSAKDCAINCAKEKIITLLKSDLENFDGLANECVERKDIHELLENNAVRRYIESTIELLESEK